MSSVVDRSRAPETGGATPPLAPARADNDGAVPTDVAGHGAAPGAVAGADGAPPARRKWRWLTPTRAVALLVGLVAVGFGIVALRQPTVGAREASTPLLGKPAPPLTAGHFSGPPLRPLLGHYTVVNFFASWCPDCMTEAPQLAQFVSAEARSGVQLVMVDDFGDSVSGARLFLSETGVRSTVLADTTGATALAWGVHLPPETFVVSPAGVVVAKFVGPVSAVQLEQLVVPTA